MIHKWIAHVRHTWHCHCWTFLKSQPEAGGGRGWGAGKLQFNHAVYCHGRHMWFYRQIALILKAIEIQTQPVLKFPCASCGSLCKSINELIEACVQPVSNLHRTLQRLHTGAGRKHSSAVLGPLLGTTKSDLDQTWEQMFPGDSLIYFWGSIGKLNSLKGPNPLNGSKKSRYSNPDVGL